MLADGGVRSERQTSEICATLPRTAGEKEQGFSDLCSRRGQHDDVEVESAAGFGSPIFEDRDETTLGIGSKLLIVTRGHRCGREAWSDKKSDEEQRER